ncbi:MAG: hypothetical protein K8S00_04675 [Bacteroidales bacterium]|nr:hypothetical protein [Bacteroidales bacterium]
MRWIVFLFFFVLLGYTKITANDNSVAGGRSAALGGSSVSLEGFWSVYNNQAGIASYKHVAVGISYENRFLINELSTKYAAIIFPVRSGVFGLSISSFGFTLYNEKKIGFAFARKFGKYFSASLQIDYLGIRIGNEYGKKDLFTFETGMQAQANSNLSLGLHIFNPPHIKLSDQYNELLPAVIKFGITYKFSKKICSTVEIEKNTYHNAVIKVGIEYLITQNVSFRIGVATQQGINSFGIGYKFKTFVFDISSSYHPGLGYISQASLIFEIKSNN